MSNQIKICRSLDENENSIWRLPNGKRLDLFVRNGTGNFRATAVDGKGAVRQVIVVDDIHDNREVIYLDEVSLDNVSGVTWLTLDTDSEEYLTEHSYDAGVPEMIDIRTGLPVGLPANGLDPEFLASIETQMPKLKESREKFQAALTAGLFHGHVTGETPERREASHNALYRLLVLHGTHPDSQGQPVAVSFKKMREWYTTERWQKVLEELKPLAVKRIHHVFPQLSANDAAGLFDMIIFDMSDEDSKSTALFDAMAEMRLNISDAQDFNLVSEIQLALGRVLIAGHIQTPWERGESIDWNL